MSSTPYDHDINPYMPTLALEGIIVLIAYMWSLGTPS